jgi:hypothetical protein
MTTPSDNSRPVSMDLDREEAETSLRGKLVTLDETAPVDPEVFDKHFALLDERDHARSPKPTPDKKRPMKMDESRPDKEQGKPRG